MTNITLTPERHQVWNEYDRTGLLLGLSRLPGEKNKDYKQRLMDVMVNRANASYRGLINGITRELGLSISETLRIRPTTSGTMPAVVFQDTKCYVYDDYGNDSLALTMDRYEYNESYWTINQVANGISGTGLFSVEILDTSLSSSRSMTIFNQSSIDIVTSEDISNAGGRYDLAHTNLITGTVSVSSPNLKRRRTSQTDLQVIGDYYIDLVNGTLYMIGQAAAGSVIRYQYRNDDFIVLSSPVIIHNLQSTDFQTKMFNQTTESDGNIISSTPTTLGADIINELLSVYPSSWGI